MNAPKKLKFPLKVALPMFWNYIKTKLAEQIKAVAFIIIYLLAFKFIVLQSPPDNVLQVSSGVALVVIGLAMFLEGLFLGLMPLGDRVGVLLPQKTNFFVIALFGLLLGFGATLAEPSIATLRLAGEGVTPWTTPLLYRFLELDTNLLVWAVGAGVGVAVAFGMARFYFGFGIKPFIFILTPICLAASIYFAYDENLKYIINLAWDTGGVTTGPVTVPLVLAMGIGISKASGKSNSAAASGLGVVTLASLFPVLAVFGLALYLNGTTPKPVSESQYFSMAYREKAVEMMKSEEAVEVLAFQRGTATGRLSYYGDVEKHEKAVKSLFDEDEKSAKLLGKLSIKDWSDRKASEQEKQWLTERHTELIELNDAPDDNLTKATSLDFETVLGEEAKNSVFAVIPLTLLLLCVLIFLLGYRLKKPDEAILGIILSLVGMALLTTGIQLGLSFLGNKIGRTLPRVYKTEAQESGRYIIRNFDHKSLFSAYSLANGKQELFFNVAGKNNQITTVAFDEKMYDPQTKNYLYIQNKEVLWTAKVTLLGMALLCLFAFGMGYGSTIAEPALNALGITVEENTVGTVKKSSVIGTVSVGVGTGLLVGVLRLILDIPACWLLVPGYVLLLILTYFCDEEFAGLAWDSGGVTTGPITVPLVLAMGLGIGGGINIIDGFGIVSMASLFPILTMLIFGIRIKLREIRHLKATEGDTNE